MKPSVFHQAPIALRLGILAILPLLLGNSVISFANQPETTRPNVLFIAIDDLNDWIGCLGGNPDTLTPNMDRLAKRGMVFENAHCPAPACIPSRSATMTGAAPYRTGLYANANGEFRKYHELENLVTLPQYFSANGYHTMGVGKILHTRPKKVDWDEPSPISHFKNPVPEPSGSDARQHVKVFLDDRAPLDVDKTEMTDWKMAKWAAQRLQTEYETPFFLGCGFYRPHLPLHAPREYYEKFPLETLTLPEVKEDDLEDLGPAQQKPKMAITEIVADETLFRKGVQAYLANNNFVDECVGLVLDALDASPHRDNTVIVLWSDHGHHKGEKFQWSKFTLWEESTRSVLICAGPDVEAGARSTQPVNLLDMYPTLIDWCGLPAREDLDGMSFCPQFERPNQKRPPTITSNHLGFSIRSNRWRFISYRDGSEELYDHQRDPMEWKNLAGNPEFAKIKKALLARLPKNPVPPREVTSEKKAKQ